MTPLDAGIKIISECIEADGTLNFNKVLAVLQDLYNAATDAAG